jgi:hypothetical protein
MLRYFFIVIYVGFISVCCTRNENQPNSNELKPKKEDTLIVNKENKLKWDNPFLNPTGSDLARMIRAYYLVGDIDKLYPFLLLPPSMDKNKLIDLLQEANWGYELKVTNVKWSNDSIFQLSVKTQKQKTTGLEFYHGKIVNDTAKLFVFQNVECPFVDK